MKWKFFLTYADVDRTSLGQCLVVGGYELRTKREKQGQLGLPMFHFPFSHRLVFICGDAQLASLSSCCEGLLCFCE